MEREQVLTALQDEFRETILSIIYHNQLELSYMTDDAVWYFGTAAVSFKKHEIRDYLDKYYVAKPVDMAELLFFSCDYVGDQCVSMVGKVVYHDVNEDRIAVSFSVIWQLLDCEWKIKQLITTSNFVDKSTLNERGLTRINTLEIFESLSVGVVCCGIEEHLPVQMLNDHALEMMGYENITEYTSLAGSSLLMSIHPDDIEDFQKYIKAIQAGEEVEDIHVRLRRKNHTFMWIHAFGGISQGKWVVLACSNTSHYQKEAEQLKQANEELSVMQEEYKTMINSMPVGFHRCTLFEPYHVDYVSDSLCEMTGYTRQDIHGTMKSIYIEMVVPEDRQPIIDAIEEIRQYPHTMEITYRMIKKDGDIMRVIDKMRSVRHADGKMWLYSVVLEVDDKGAKKIPNNELEALMNNVVEKDPAVKHVNGKKAKLTDKGHSVEIRTFGYFEVLVDNQPIAFRSAKARELLAILVDRRGNFTSRESIISMLWENETINPTTLTRCRKTYKYLVDELKVYGIEDIVESENGWRRVVSDKITCDLFDYMNGDPSASNAFQGMYLNEYSWSEITLSALLSQAKTK